MFFSLRLFIVLSLALCSVQSVSGQVVDAELNKLQLAWQLISTFYVDSVDEHELTEEAIRAMLEQLDPHSVYIPSEELQAMNEPLDGNFEGVGIEFMILHDTLVVISTISGGPSERVGLMAGDRIVEVDGTNMVFKGLSNKDVFDALRGPRGSQVNLLVMRGGANKLLKFVVERDKIPIHSIEAAYMASPNTGYIKISRFAQNTHQEFVEALEKLKQEGMNGLMLDLRGNGGGYLKAALDVVDEFIGSHHLLLYTQGLAVPRSEYHSTKGGVWEKGPLVILMDEGSASASEIVAGAIQDWDRGVIVGRRSFGKGLVQRPLPLSDGSEIRLTIAKYFTPTGRCIQKPYGDQKGDYQTEIYERYLHGEMMHRDSIHLSDTLGFKTMVRERPVFGGGGIMPDIFIPLDTSMYSDYYRDLVASGVFNRTVLDQLDSKRAQWHEQYPSFDDFYRNFMVSPATVEALVKQGVASGIALDSSQMKVSAPLIRLQLKALIARNLWSTAEYYRVINPEMTFFEKGLRVVEDRDLYSKIFY